MPLNIRSDNNCVCDLNKAQWATLYYKNQYGNVHKTKPKVETVHGSAIPDGLHITEKIPMIDYAKKYNLLDIWTPICRVIMTANKSLSYTGDKAKSIWREWNRRIFTKKKG